MNHRPTLRLGCQWVCLFVLLPLGRLSLSASEVRGIWITRWDYHTEDEARRAIRWSAAIGMNRVFFQVRGRADAYYRSTHEPWGEEIGGEDPGFDPLAVAIDEAHKSGVELHAWINVMPGWKGSSDPSSPNHVLHQHPDWFLVDRSGKRHLKDASDYTILNPCLPEVRQYIIGVVRDIVSRYAVQGIQLDYMRFIGRGSAKNNDFPYDPRTLQLFRKYSGVAPSDAPEEWNKWRGLAVDTLVYRLSEAARKARPGVRVSVAAIQDYRRARDDLFQDVVKWEENGWIDEVYPMTYHKDPGPFRTASAPLVRASGASKVILGIGVHLHDNAEETAKQIQIARSMKAGGYCLFAYSNFFPSPSHESRSGSGSDLLRKSLRDRVRELNGIPPPARQPSRAVSANVPKS